MRVQILEMICNSVCTLVETLQAGSRITFPFRQTTGYTKNTRTEVQQSSDLSSAKTQTALKPHVGECRPARPNRGSGRERGAWMEVSFLQGVCL